jgi:hypothetical protein
MELKRGDVTRIVASNIGQSGQQNRIIEEVLQQQKIKRGSISRN